MRVLTAFTRSVPGPTGFALACQTDKGLGPEVDYMAVRRAEDAEALRRLGLPEPVHLAFPEAPHRGYASAQELFAGVRADDGIAEALARELIPELAGADVVLAPLGLGGHVDHLQVLAALGDRTVVHWHDLPYALREPGPARAHTDSRARAHREAKLGACAAYTSQLGFQFGGERAMREALRAVPEHFNVSLPL